MEEKKYLDEQTFQKNKKMLMRISLIILIVGVLIGGSIIVTGIIKGQKRNESGLNNNGILKEVTDNINNVNKEINNQTTNKRTENEVQNDINNTQTKINTLNEEIATLNNEQMKVFKENGFNEKYQELGEKIRIKREETTSLSFKISKYELELEQIKRKPTNDKDIINNTVDDVINGTMNNILNNTVNEINKTKSIGYYMVGGFILFATFIISGALFVTAKKREITAFGVQQAMPVAQEGAEKLAPSIGNIAKEITKGVEEGKK
ncbi:MAG: hypothetical protein RR228_02415 [Bacilli bacterium]